MIKKLNYVFFACMLGWAFVVQQEPSKERSGVLPGYEGEDRYNEVHEERSGVQAMLFYSAHVPGEEELREKQREQRHERALVARTLKFLSEGSDMNSFEHLSITPEQQAEFSKAFDEFRELVEKLETYDDDELRKLLNTKSSFPSNPAKRKRMLANYRVRLEKAWIASISESMMEMQIDEIVKWSPENQRGLAKTLTETPIGSALGLSDSQLKKLRKRCDEIGGRLYKEYVKARLEAEELFAETLTEEQIAQLRKLYYPHRSSKYGIIKDDLYSNKIIGSLTYDYPKDALKELKEKGKFARQDRPRWEEQNNFAVPHH